MRVTRARLHIVNWRRDDTTENTHDRGMIDRRMTSRPYEGDSQRRILDCWGKLYRSFHEMREGEGCCRYNRPPKGTLQRPQIRSTWDVDSQVTTIRKRSMERSTGWEATRKQQYTGARNKETNAVKTESLNLGLVSHALKLRIIRTLR